MAHGAEDRTIPYHNHFHPPCTGIASILFALTFPDFKHNHPRFRTKKKHGVTHSHTNTHFALWKQPVDRDRTGPLKGLRTDDDDGDVLILFLFASAGEIVPLSAGFTLSNHTHTHTRTRTHTHKHFYARISNTEADFLFIASRRTRLSPCYFTRLHLIYYHCTMRHTIRNRIRVFRAKQCRNFHLSKTVPNDDQVTKRETSTRMPTGRNDYGRSVVG